MEYETLSSSLEEGLADLTPSLAGAGELGPYLSEVAVEELGPYLLEVAVEELGPCLSEVAVEELGPYLLEVAVEEPGPYSLVVRKGVVLEPMVALFEQLIHLIQLDLVMQAMTPVLAL